MLKIKIIAVGKVKEKYFADGIAEYLKRISRFAAAEIIEIPERAPKKDTAAEIESAVNAEGADIIKNISGLAIALAIEGESISSEGLAKTLEKAALTASCVSFIIGGSNGLSHAVKARADTLLSFSEMTFPHTMFRLMLTEQIYRALAINGGLPYHK